MLITFRPTWDPLDLVLCYTSLRTVKPWLRWESKAGVQQWDTCQERPGVLWIVCLIRLIWTQKFKSVRLTRNTNSQTCWLKGISHVLSGTIFFICSTSAISATPCCTKNFSLISCSKTMAKRIQDQKEEDRIATSKPTMNLVSLVSTRSSSVNHPIASKSPMILKSIYSETWREGNKKFKTRRSVEFSRKVERCTLWRIDGWSSGGNLPRQIKVRKIMGLFWIWIMEQSWAKPVASRKLEDENGHIIFICLQQLYLAWRKSIRSYDKFTAEVQRMIWMTSTRTPLYGVYSWMSHSKLQFILVETIWENLRLVCGIVVPSDKVGWGSDKNQWPDHDWLQRAYVEIDDDDATWQSDWDYECPNLCLRRLGAVWGVSAPNQSKPGRTKLNGIWKLAISKIWIESMESRRNSSGKYPQDSLHWAFSRRFKKYDRISLWARAVPRKDHLHVSVQRHCVGRTRKQNNARRILSQLRNMFADSRSDVGHFWDLDQRRNGTELTVINQMENGTRLLNEWCSTLQNPVILYFVL